MTGAPQFPSPIDSPCSKRSRASPSAKGIMYNQYEIVELSKRYGAQDSLLGMAVRALESYLNLINGSSDGWGLLVRRYASCAKS